MKLENGVGQLTTNTSYLKEIFKTIDYYLWRLLGKWCERRHANKPWKWIRAKYFSASEEACSFASVTTSKKGNT
ncbi:MAG: hypothetical protein JW922_10050, partial [Paludibacteraceae bacterium]|nr:hypothetical protein [Paludibacteraceae bacterium]